MYDKLDELAISHCDHRCTHNAHEIATMLNFPTD